MNSALNKQKIWFIINPISGIGKQKIVEKLIATYIDLSLYEVEIKYTKKPKHAIDISKTAVEKNIDIVAIVGGDGSVNEAAKGVVNSNTKLAIIPSGSGNGFARSLNIPVNLKKSIINLNKAKKESVDTLTFNQTKLAVGVIGLGFDAHVAHQFKNYGKRGFKSYIKITIKEFFRYKGIEFTLNNIKYKNVFLISIANSKQFGNNAYITPLAKLNDGKLDICIIKKFPLWYAPILAIKLFNKTIDKSKYIEYIQDNSVKIETNETEIHYDGETDFIKNQLSVKINPTNLKIYK